ncbi:MAG TPA: hypothetical protein VFI90_15780 [Rubrobacter sp.]|nr:hypothetical protein [Rubrobacter sp.]
MHQRDIVLTGPGRSGTTLVCHLLNKLPNTLALSEPIPPGKFAHLMPDTEAICDEIERYYHRMRMRALRRGTAISKHVGGVVPDNTKGMVGDVRDRVADKGKIETGKDLRADFSLVIKQPGLFTALLPSLAKRFRCYAIVRNPLALMGSRRSLLRSAERKGRKRTRPSRMYDEELARLEAERRALARARAPVEQRIDRQLRALSLRFERYLRELPVGNVLRYEDIASSNGRVLEVLVPAACELNEPLENMNANPYYDREYMLAVGERLLESEGSYWRLYSREEVEELLGQLRYQTERGP